MSEKDLSKYVRDLISRFGHVESHEDRYKTGIPDLSYGVGGINGWIELKYLPSWPTKPEAPVKLRRFTPAQRNWLQSRGAAGGHCFLLLQVKDEYLLFHHSVIGDIDGFNKSHAIARSGHHWHRLVTASEFRLALVA